MSFNGIRALYFHFLNLLKKAEKRTDEQIPFVLKEDLRKLDEISQQTILLMKNNIETEEQLEDFIHNKEMEIEKLCADRKQINFKLYRAPAETKTELQKQRDALSDKISELRKDLKTARGVVKRQEEIS